MSYCAYELNIDTNNIRAELLTIYNNNKKEQVSKYGDIFYNNISNKFTNTFHGCILKKVRFSCIPASYKQQIGYGWHVDNNAAKEDLYQDEGVPSQTAIPCTINILLSNPVGDITYFGRPNILEKFSITTPSWELNYNDDDMTIIDSIETKLKPVLLNTSTFHKIHASKVDRVIASFCIWPGISFVSFVDWCKNKNLIVER